MLCPNCESEKLDWNMTFSGREAIGPTRDIQDDNIFKAVIKLIWLLISKMTFSEISCQTCHSTFMAIKAHSIQVLWGFAITGGLIGLFTGPIPGTSCFLLILELVMLVAIGLVNRTSIHIAELGCAMMLIMSITQLLKSLALIASVEIMTFIPGFGYLGQTLVGFTFIFLFGLALDSYYTAKRSQAGA